MSKMIQIRHVPDVVHRTLKARAAKKGMSLSDYLLGEITELAKLPALADTFADIELYPPIEWREPVAATIRKMRDAR